MDVELALAVDRVAGESAPTVVWLTESKRKEEASSVSKTSTASVVRRSIVRARQSCVSTSVRPAGAARPLPPLSGASVEGELSEPVTASNPRPSQSAWRVGPTTASAARAPSPSGCERTWNVERSTSATGACAWTTKARPLERSTANPGSQLSVTRPLDSVPERIPGSAAERIPPRGPT